MTFSFFVWVSVSKPTRPIMVDSIKLPTKSNRAKRLINTGTTNQRLYFTNNTAAEDENAQDKNDAHNNRHP